jgi:hypothetical protein
MFRSVAWSDPMMNRLLLPLLSLSLAAVFGCAGKAAAPPKAGSAATRGAGGTLEVGEVSSLHEGEAVTDDEALAVAKAIEAAINSGNTEALNQAFDWDAFQELIVAGIPSNTAAGRSLRKGIAQGARKAGEKFATLLFDQTKAGGSFEFVRIRNQTAGKCLLFRVKSHSGGLNYHEVYVVRRNSRVRAVDIYVHTSGQRLSETIHQLAIPTLPPDVRIGFGGRGKAKVSPEDLEKLAQMTAAIRSGQGQQAVEIYRSLPEELRKTKGAKVLHVQAGQLCDHDTYLAAIDDFKDAFPKDSSLHLMALDGYFLRKDYDAVHESITALDEAVGGDPHLMMLHAGVFLVEGKLELARQVAEGQRQLNPRSRDVHWMLVTIALREKDHAAVAGLLTKIRDELGVPIADLQTRQEYAEFVKSPEYAEWLKTPPM